MKMNLVFYLVFLELFCLDEVHCKSISVVSDSFSGPQINEEKSLNYDHGHGSKISWRKLKPLFRWEIQQTQKKNGTDAHKIHRSLAKNKQLLNSENKQAFIGNPNKLKMEDANFKADLQMKNTSIKSELATTNGIFEQGLSLPNVTNVEKLKLDPPLTTEEFPYINTQDMLTEKNEYVAILSLSENGYNTESTESEEFFLLKDGTDVVLQALPLAAKEAITDFKTQQNSIQTELPTSQIIHFENNFTESANEDFFKVSKFEFTNGPEYDLEETTTHKQALTFSDESEAKEGRYKNGNDTDDTQLNFTSFPVDVKTEYFNSGELAMHLNKSDSKNISFESSERALSNNGVTVAFQVLTEIENKNLSNLKSKQDFIPTEFPTFRKSLEDGENLTDVTKEKYFNVLTFIFNHSRENELRKNGTNAGSPIITDASVNSTHTIKAVNTKPNFISSFQDEKFAEISFIGPKLPKCPDPGLCIFWFAAQDLCSQDSHCHGPLICCMWGCSKMCVDGENVFSRN